MTAAVRTILDSEELKEELAQCLFRCFRTGEWCVSSEQQYFRTNAYIALAQLERLGVLVKLEGIKESK